MTKPVAVLIGCTVSKRNKPCKAGEMYIPSQLFRKSFILAKKTGLPIYILSAKYGLISENRIIAPYDLTLKLMSQTELDQWAISVAEQVKAIIGDGDLLVLASEIYLTFARHINNKIINPLNKLRIGKRSQWLSKSIAE